LPGAAAKRLLLEYLESRGKSHFDVQARSDCFRNVERQKKVARQSSESSIPPSSEASSGFAITIMRRLSSR
jgi:hypothetical protein